MDQVSSAPIEWLYPAPHRDEEDLEEICYTRYTELQITLAYEAFRELNLGQYDDGPVMGDRLGYALDKFAHLRRLELHDQHGTVYGDKDDDEQDALALCSPWKNSLINPDAYYRSLVDDYSDLEGTVPEPHVLFSAHALRYIMRSLALQSTGTGMFLESKKWFSTLDTTSRCLTGTSLVARSRV